MSNRARNPLTRKLMFVAAFVMVSAIVTLAAFGPQAISLQRFFIGASAEAKTFKEVEPQLHAEPPAALTFDGTLATARSGHTATLLADGKILIVGGSGDTSAEVFDPATGMAVATGNTNHARTGHTANRLADGRVLIAGGGSASTEIYDPAAGTFSNGADMNASRTGHTATAIGSNVIITGGGNDTVEVFNGTEFTAAGSLTAARTNHSAIAMNDGRLFIAGGTGSDTAEIYNPADGTSVATGNPLAHVRAKAHLRVLPDGKVQIIGGNDDVSMEVYDPAIDTIGAHVHLLPDTDTCTGLRTGVRDSQSRAALFYAGNADASYDRTGHTITEVAGNRALVIGGTTGGSSTNSVTEFASSPATITTDKLDYAPGETVTFTGTGFAPGETVRVVIHEDPHTHLERNFEAVADTSGNISGSYLVEEHDLNVKFIVNARGLTSNLTAQTAFTDDKGLTITFAGAGTGSISVTVNAPNAADSFNCTGNPCDGQVDNNATGTITVTPNPGSVFTGWTGSFVSGGTTTCTGTATSCTFSMSNAAQNLTATFGGNAAPNTPANLTQFKADGVTAIAVGGATNQTSVVLKGAVSDPNAPNTVKLQVEVKPIGIAFTNTPTNESVLVGNGSTASVTVPGLANGVSYHWQARTVDNSGSASAWTSFGGNSEVATDFSVDTTAPTILSITRNGASPTNAGQVTWTITFSESVTGVDPFDFTVPMTGLTGTASLSLFGGGGTTYTFTTGTRNGSGTIGLNLNDDDSITDAAGNKLGGNGTGVAGGGGTGNGSLVGQVYTIDRTITTVIVANDKPYDGGTAATLTSCTRTSALPITDDVNVVCSSPTFDDPNAGTRTVTANISLTGADASRYVLSSTTATDTADITAIAADCSSVAGQTVPYDGNAHVGVGACKDLGGNAIAGLSWGTGQTDVPGGLVSWSFTSANPNYQNNAGGNVTVTITPAPTTTVINCSAASFVYTGSPITPCTANVTGANLATTTAVTYGSNTNVGTATANATYGGDSNHSGSTATEVTFAITPASTTTTVTCPASEVYTGAAIEPCTFTVTGANLTVGPSPLASGDYSNNVIVGIATASYTYVPDANHTGSSDSKIFNITPASSATVVTCPASKVYTGLPIEPCTFTVTGANLNIGPSPLASTDYSSNTNVGTATASHTYVPDANHTGSDNSTTFEILQAATALTVSPAQGTYGGTVDLYATLTRTDAPAGPLEGKTISFKLNGNSVGTAVTDINGQAALLGVYLTTNGTPSGTRFDAGTYLEGVEAVFAAETNFTGSDDKAELQVDKKPLTASVTAQNKPYDGNASATINLCTVATLETDDVVTCSAAGPNTFATVNAASGKTVTATNISLAGDDAANYVLSSTSATTTADILKKGLGANLVAANKVYDGNTDEPDANMSCSFIGIVSGEELNITCTPSAGSFNFKDVLAATQVNATVTLSGTAAGNYTLGADGTSINSTGASAAASITPRLLTASIVNNPTKPYDGNTNATLAPTNFSLSNLVGTENFDVTQASGTYAPDANAGAKTVSASLALGDFTPVGATLASNYTFPTSASGAGTITTVDPDCSSITGGTYPYDGNAHGATGSCKDINGADLTNLSLGASFTDVPGGTANWTFTSTNANYNNKLGSVLITITAISPNCSIVGGTFAYDGNAHGASGSCKDLGGNDLSGLNLGSAFTDVPGGTANWTFTSANVNYTNSSGSVGIVITAIPANCSSIAGGTFAYNGNSHGATGSCKDLGGNDLSGLNLGATFTDVPGGTANWTFTSANVNYTNSNGSVGIVITPIDANCSSITGGSHPYDGNPHTLTGSCKDLGGNDLAGLVFGTGQTDVPGGAVTWTFTSPSANYNSDSGSEIVTITAIDPNCSSITGGTFPYDSNAHGATGSCKDINGAILTTLNLGSSFTDAPGGVANWTFTSTNTNYNNKSGSVSIVITKVDPTCTTISGYTGVYDGNAHGASGTCTGVAGQTIPTIGSLNLGASFTDVPGGTANWSFTGGTNYNNKTGSVSITISKATPTVTVSFNTAPVIPYDGFGHPATVTVTGVSGPLAIPGNGSTAITYARNTLPFAGSPTLVGAYTASATFTSTNGNYTNAASTTNATLTIGTIYNCFNGFLSPVGGSVENGNGGTINDPVRTFKLNSTIPFKFILYSAAGCSGTPVTTGIHTIQLQKVSNTTDLETAIDATPTDAATTGNQFRLTGTEWHFNLDTKRTPGVTAGTWLVTATLQDGSTKTVWISIKK